MLRITITIVFSACIFPLAASAHVKATTGFSSSAHGFTSHDFLVMTASSWAALAVFGFIAYIFHRNMVKKSVAQAQKQIKKS